MRKAARSPRRTDRATFATVLAVSAATALLGASGCAHTAKQPITATGGGPVSHARISETVRPPEPRVVDVHAALLRGALTTCTYRSLITGTLRVTPPPNNSNDLDAASYEPDLTVNAQVVCPDTQSERHETHVLQGQRMTRDQLLEALRSNGSLPVNRGDHVCTVRPGFSFDGEAVYGYQVTDTCGAPVGGGPRTEEMTAQSNQYGHAGVHPIGWRRRFVHPHALNHPVPATLEHALHGQPGAGPTPAAPTGVSGGGPRMCPCPDNAP